MLPVLVGTAVAQQAPPVEWKPVVELRERLDGDLDVGEIAQRARVGIEASRTIVTVRVSFQDVRSWESTGGTVRAEPFSPEVAEAWAKVRGVLNRNLYGEAQVGRQALLLHDGRLLGTDDFDMAGQFFDALRLSGVAAPLHVEYIHARRFVDEGASPLGYGVNVLRAGGERADAVTSWTVDALWLVDARRTEHVSQTGGMYVRFDSGRWRARAEVYAQAQDDGGGSLVAGSAGRVFGPDERWIVQVLLDSASGDSGNGSWSPILGDSHRFWGLVDRFGNAPEARGVTDLHVRMDSRPIPQLAAALEIHRFTSPVDGGTWGHEVDTTLAWAFTPFSDLVAGIGAYLGEVPEEPDAAFGYLELDVEF